jgi:hypothetical protein
MPEREVVGAMKDEARRLLLGKKAVKSLFCLPLVVLSGGPPVWRYLAAAAVRRVKGKVPWGGTHHDAEIGKAQGG